MYKGEFFNSISHLIGAVLALIGASVLVTLASIEGDTTKLVSVTIYGISLFVLYLSSTLYHSFNGQVKLFFKQVDHFAIYLLIAGTYTPFALLAVKGAAGWWLLASVWTLAIVGIVVENLPIKGPRIIPVIICVAMCWSCIFTLDSMVNGMSPMAFNLLLAGGVSYSIGVIFYILDHFPIPHMHQIWHVLVIGGSACHYFSILML